MDQTLKQTLAVECERIRCFLHANQLVQANAIAQKIESTASEVIAKECRCNEVETHPLWKVFRAALRCKNKILSGITTEAIDEANTLMEHIVLMEQSK